MASSRETCGTAHVDSHVALAQAKPRPGTGRWVYDEAVTAHGRPVYRDRLDAGQILARLLPQSVDPATVVLGLPRGGVIVAAPLARACSLPLDVLVARKLTHPLQPELAIGAVGSGSVVVVDQGAARHFGLTRAQIDILVARATAEVEARLAFYRSATGRDPPESDENSSLTDPSLRSPIQWKARSARPDVSP